MHLLPAAILKQAEAAAALIERTGLQVDHLLVTPDSLRLCVNIRELHRVFPGATATVKKDCGKSTFSLDIDGVRVEASQYGCETPTVYSVVLGGGS